MNAVKIAAAALAGAAVVYLVVKQARVRGLRIPTRGELCHGFGGYAGQFASPGIESSP